MEKQRTIVIVFPPLTMPTSPPLGAAMLKGFVERELPSWRVKILDLNIWSFERLFEALVAGRLPLNSRVFPEGTEAAKGLLCAEEIFRGKNDDDFYHRPDLYEKYGDLFLRFIESFSNDLQAMCDAFDRGGQLSPIIQEFLQRILSERPDAVGIAMIFPYVSFAALTSTNAWHSAKYISTSTLVSPFKMAALKSEMA